MCNDRQLSHRLALCLTQFCHPLPPPIADLLCLVFGLFQYANPATSSIVHPRDISYLISLLALFNKFCFQTLRAPSETRQQKFNCLRVSGHSSEDKPMFVCNRSLLSPRRQTSASTDFHQKVALLTTAECS